MGIGIKLSNNDLLIGKTENLTTAEKGSLVGAVNEINANLSALCDEVNSLQAENTELLQILETV